MISLLRVELTRLRWRRAVLLLMTAAVLVPAIIWAATAWNTRPVSAEETSRAEQMVVEESQQPYIQRELRRCLKNPDNYGKPPGQEAQAHCEQQLLPRVEWYTYRSSLDLNNERLNGSGLGVIVVLTLLMLMIGTTFIGHDWNSGSMSNQLLFEPRRLRVWAAKGLVVLLSGFVLCSVVLAAYWSGLGLLAAQRDLTVPDGVLRAAYEQGLRGALFAAFAGLGGYAMTMLFRSTVATLGILFAVAIAGPLIIALLGFPGNERWMPQNNFSAIVLDGFDYYPQDFVYVDEGVAGGAPPVPVHMTRVDGALYYGGLLLVACAPSALSFRRRDVP